MKKTTLIAAAIGSLMLTGCATTTPMKTTFDSNAVSWVKEEGGSTVRGQSFMRTMGGNVKTCAGFQVTLYPVSDYSEERVSIIFGDNFQAFRAYGFFGSKPPKAPAEYKQYTLKTICDASGSFEFEDVPTGEYFLWSEIQWHASADSIVPEGGALMQRIKVKPNSNKKYILTR